MRLQNFSFCFKTRSPVTPPNTDQTWLHPAIALIEACRGKCFFVTTAADVCLADPRMFSQTAHVRRLVPRCVVAAPS